MLIQSDKNVQEHISDHISDYISRQEIEKLIKGALEARNNSYAPYSNFAVGACLISEDGRYFTGCNVENASYGMTNCAERTAIFKGVSEGVRKLKAIAIAGGTVNEMPDTYAYPCGACRQVIREFSVPETMVVIVAKSTEDYKTYFLEQLLPDSFGPEFQERK